jgi:hypothetical protein
VRSLIKQFILHSKKEIINLVVKYFPQADRFKDPFGLFGAAGAGESGVVEGFNINARRSLRWGLSYIPGLGMGQGSWVIDTDG